MMEMFFTWFENISDSVSKQKSQRLGDVWTTMRLLSLCPAVEMDVWMAA